MEHEAPGDETYTYMNILRYRCVAAFLAFRRQILNQFCTNMLIHKSLGQGNGRKTLDEFIKGIAWARGGKERHVEFIPCECTLILFWGFPFPPFLSTH